MEEKDITNLEEIISNALDYRPNNINLTKRDINEIRKSLMILKSKLRNKKI